MRLGERKRKGSWVDRAHTLHCNCFNCLASLWTGDSGRVLTSNWHPEGALHTFTDKMNKDFPVAFLSFTDGKTKAKGESGNGSASHS